MSVPQNREGPIVETESRGILKSLCSILPPGGIAPKLTQVEVKLSLLVAKELHQTV